MAKRTVALCDGKYIGIETIYTVIGGKQINIPDKLKELRRKSQNNKLFCPCGCGANLILVAGDKNLREQHFRIKDGLEFEDCTVVTEGKTSIESKIVLKCWLDDNLHAEDLESRVPICDVSESSRKYEYTFISRSLGIAIDYCHNRAFLSDEKQAVLEAYGRGIKIIHIVDEMNSGTEGQYPENLMKVQTKQGYCLLLSIEGVEYDAAEMKAAFYAQDVDGYWQEVVFAEGMLKEFRIDLQGDLFFKGARVTSLLEGATQRFREQNDAEMRRREEKKRRFEERRKQLEKEHELWLEEQRKQAEEAERVRLEREEKARAEKRRIEEAFHSNMALALAQQQTPVFDSKGNRWIRCEFCGKIAVDSEFASYGGEGRANLGTCKECSENNPAVLEALERAFQQKQTVKIDLSICPECGAKLIGKIGVYGRFMGCTNYPKCRYTRPLKK